MSQKGFWFAFGVGAAIGAGIALLYAPQSGVATRKKLKRSIDDAGDYLEDAGDYLKDQAEKLSKEAHKAIKLTKDYADNAVDAAGEFVAGAAKSVKQVKSSLI
jgi:gas vesicle protein